MTKTKTTKVSSRAKRGISHQDLAKDSAGPSTLLRALLLISGALTLIGASPQPSPKERGLQTSSQTKNKHYDNTTYYRAV